MNDATTNTVLAVATPTLGSGLNYAVVAYESGGSVRTTLIQENTAAPVSGTANLRIFNTATDAGAIDVYVTDPSTDLSTLSSPTFSFSSSSSTQATSFLSLTPGPYRVRVTGAGNTADLRLDMPLITIAAGQNATVILTPTTGGTLANGSVLVEQGAYAATPNTNLRIRLFAAVTDGSTVSASAGTTPIGPSVTSPSVGTYTLVPGSSTVTVTVNGAAVTPPAAALTAGSDTTLMVYGSAAAPPVSSLVLDDNHLPTVVTNFKLRLVNGLTGVVTPLTLLANFGVVASNVAPGTASAYSVVGASQGASQGTRLDVLSPFSPVPLVSQSNLNIPGNAVYSLFMLGDASVPEPRPPAAERPLRRVRQPLPPVR